MKCKLPKHKQAIVKNVFLSTQLDSNRERENKRNSNSEAINYCSLKDAIEIKTFLHVLHTRPSTMKNQNQFFNLSRDS